MKILHPGFFNGEESVFPSPPQGSWKNLHQPHTPTSMWKKLCPSPFSTPNCISPCCPLLAQVLNKNLRPVKILHKKNNHNYILCTYSLEGPSFRNSQTEHDMETKHTSIDFSRQGPNNSRSLWLQTLSSQITVSTIPHTLGITNCKCYLLYYFYWIINEPQANVHVVYT